MALVPPVPLAVRWRDRSQALTLGGWRDRRRSDISSTLPIALAWEERVQHRINWNATLTDENGSIIDYDSGNVLVSDGSYTHTFRQLLETHCIGYSHVSVTMYR